MADLIDVARLARENAYAPYSGYKVGAALRDQEGQIWGGCNVENISYPQSMCAERNAVARMVAAGGREVEEIAVLTRDGGTPCGGCLQVLMEFSSNPAKTRVHAMSEDGSVTTYSLLELMPHSFASEDVKRTERKA